MALMRTVGACVAIAEHAGGVLRKIMDSGDMGIVDKGGQNNLQTKADKEAQVLIVSTLLHHFPGVTVIGEEEGDVDYTTPEARASVVSDVSCDDVTKHTCPDSLSALTEEDLVIWVDPLDGTKEYTEGRKQDVTVLIGIAAAGKAIAGIINQPWYLTPDGVECSRTLWGVVGLGGFGFNPVPVPEGRNIITTTRSHMAQSVADAIEACKPTGLIQIGGSGSKCILVIEGTADAYLFASPGTKKWDTCAGEAIIRAMGGEMTDVFGKEIRYDADVAHPNKTGVLAAMRNLDFYLSKVPANIMDRK